MRDATFRVGETIHVVYMISYDEFNLACEAVVVNPNVVVSPPAAEGRFVKIMPTKIYFRKGKSNNGYVLHGFYMFKKNETHEVIQYIFGNMDELPKI
jgi:hypothetical protein